MAATTHLVYTIDSATLDAWMPEGGDEDEFADLLGDSMSVTLIRDGDTAGIAWGPLGGLTIDIDLDLEEDELSFSDEMTLYATEASAAADTYDDEWLTRALTAASDEMTAGMAA